MILVQIVVKYRMKPRGLNEENRSFKMISENSFPPLENFTKSANEPLKLKIYKNGRKNRKFTYCLSSNEVFHCLNIKLT